MSNSRVIKFLLFSLLFCVLYGPRLKVADIMLYSVLIVGSLNAFSFLSLKRKINGAHKKIFCSLFFLIFCAICFYLYHGFSEFSFVELTFKCLIYFLAAEAVYMLYFNVYKDRLVILNDVLYATALNAVFVIALYVSPDVQNFASQIFDYNKQLNWLGENEVRRVFDLSLGGGATASFVFSLVVLIAFLSPSGLKSKKQYAALILVFGATALTGRTGVYFNVLTLLIVVMTKATEMQFTKVLNYKVVIGACLLALLFIVLDLQDSATLRWLLQGLTNEENMTANALRSMWFMPEQNLMLGDGYFGRIPPNIIYSDIGYVRTLHAVGLIGTIIMYGWLVSLVLLRINKENALSFKVQNIFLYMVLYILLMNFKELHIGARGTTVLMFIVLMVALSSSRRKVAQSFP